MRVNNIMKNNKQIYDIIIEFSNAHKDIISTINTVYLTNNATEALKGVVNEIDKSGITEISRNLSAPNDALITLKEAISKVVPKHDKALKDSIAAFTSIQTSIAEQLKISYPTEMIVELTASFKKANFEVIPEVINDTIQKQTITATDMAFLKTKGLMKTYKDKIVLPKGMKTSLDTLNKQSAEEIAPNKEIQYDTKNNRFISGNSIVGSGEMNIICSGKRLLNSSGGDYFTEKELMDFQSVLSRKLTMALKDQVGQRIYDLLNNMYKSNTNKIGFDCEEYYHSRKRGKDTAPYPADEMMKAPHGCAGPGRYNHPGRSHYYFADSIIGSESEIIKHLKDDEKEDVVVQTIKLIPDKVVELLDLSGYISGITTFLKFIRFPLSELTSNTPREYLIPCFVADCCIDIGYEGIKYYGTKEYNNYVTWLDGYFKDGGMC